MSEDRTFSLKVKMQRGRGTDNRDTFTAEVAADDLETLDERVNNLREKMEGWSVEFRHIQPSDARQLADDQSDLTEVAES